VGLERGPLSLVSTIEKLLERKSSCSGLETENTAVGIHHADHVAPLYPQKLALTSPKSGCRSVGIVRSRTQVTVFFLAFPYIIYTHKYIGRPCNSNDQVVPQRMFCSMTPVVQNRLRQWLS
jgi:hypothetical protein